MIIKLTNTNALTEKGVLKPQVRQSASELIKKELLKVQRNGSLMFDTTDTNKNCLYVEFVDKNGQSFYGRVDIVVSATSPADLAPRTRKASPKTNIEPKWDYE